MSTCSRTWEKRATGIEITGLRMKAVSVESRILSPRLLIGVFVLIASLAAMSQDQPAAQTPAAQPPRSNA